MKHTPIALLLLIATACSGGESYETSAQTPSIKEVEVALDPAPVIATKPKSNGVVASTPQDAMGIGTMPDVSWGDQAVAKVELDGGLVVEYFTVGEGPTVKKYKRVLVHYQGWVKGSNQTFDSSFTRGAPIEFPVGAGGVIAGWDDGFLGMPVGSRARLHIPAAMGYGAGGNAGAGIAPNSDLVFDVNLVAIIKK